MSRAALLAGAMTLAAMGYAETMPRHRISGTPGAFGSSRRPNPRRYFGGRAGRRMARLLARQEGRKS